MTHSGENVEAHHDHTREDIEGCCDELRQSINQFTHLSHIIGLYIASKLSVQIFDIELPYLMNAWHEDPIAIVLGGIFGYGLISIGIKYLQVTTILENNNHGFTKQEIQTRTTVRFFQLDENDFTIGYTIIGVGIGIVMLSIVMMLSVVI